MAKTKPTARRPDPNQPPTVNLINVLSQDVLYLITELSNYAANLRALDRKRHNGVGLRRQGFIEAAFRSLVEVCRSLEEKAWNINVEASDMALNKAPRQAVLMTNAA